MKARICAISYDPVSVLREFAHSASISFPMLSDSESMVIRAYGVLNREMTGERRGAIRFDGVAMPGTFIVDQNGTLRASLFFDGFEERHNMEGFLDAIGQLDM